jgi:hypothetical protein
VTTAQLLGIYRRRRAHLAQMRSAHAQALANDVAWFCMSLEAVPQGRVAFWFVKIGHPYGLTFFIDAETNKVLGCMKDVSELDVTPEEWEQLWSND